jgi:hypothetical protein
VRRIGHFGVLVRPFRSFNRVTMPSALKVRTVRYASLRSSSMATAISIGFVRHDEEIQDRLPLQHSLHPCTTLAWIEQIAMQSPPESSWSLIPRDGGHMPAYVFRQIPLPRCRLAQDRVQCAGNGVLRAGGCDGHNPASIG